MAVTKITKDVIEEIVNEYVEINKLIESELK